MAFLFLRIVPDLISRRVLRSAWYVWCTVGEPLIHVNPAADADGPVAVLLMVDCLQRAARRIGYGSVSPPQAGYRQNRSYLASLENPYRYQLYGPLPDGR
jgi:hypothetical protein